MSQGKHLVAMLALLGALSGWSTAGATTLRLMDLTEMVQAADRVVRARATDAHVSWDAARKQIHTDTTFEVLETAKGEGPTSVTVTMLGGRIDPFEMRAEGTPVFRVGQEVILLTSSRPDGKEDIVGFSQGVFRILEDPRGRRLVTAGTAPGASTAMLPVDLFMDHVRALASSGAPAPDTRRMQRVPVTGSEVTP
jgi:hypothetical protein